MLKLSLCFDKINQTKSFRICTLNYQNRPKFTFLRNPVRKNGSLKIIKIFFKIFFKNYLDFFWKSIKRKAVSYLLDEKAKTFHVFSQNSLGFSKLRAALLVFRFNDSYVYHPNEILKEISITSCVPISKTYSKMSTYLKASSFCTHLL